MKTAKYLLATLTTVLSVLITHAGAEEQLPVDSRIWAEVLREGLSDPNSAGVNPKPEPLPWPDHLLKEGLEARALFMEEQRKLYLLLKDAAPEERKTIRNLLREQSRAYAEFRANLHLERRALLGIMPTVPPGAAEATSSHLPATAASDSAIDAAGTDQSRTAVGGSSGPGNAQATDDGDTESRPRPSHRQSADEQDGESPPGSSDQNG